MPQGLPPPSGPFMRTGSQEPGPVGTNEGKTGRKPGRAHSTAFASALYPSDLGTFLPGAGGSFSRSTFRPRRPYFPCCTAAFLSLFLFRSEALGEPRALVRLGRAVSGAIRGSPRAARRKVGGDGETGCVAVGLRARGVLVGSLGEWMGEGALGLGVERRLVREGWFQRAVTRVPEAGPGVGWCCVEAAGGRRCEAPVMQLHSGVWPDVHCLFPQVQTWPSPRTTPRTTSHENGTETASRNPGHKDTNLLRGPQVPEEHALCQEAQQEGPEEDAGQQCQGHGCAC
ncbi:60S ribosomal protein L29 isoform X1 [Canis lupus dingo]|uniref:60S ribosomal protein L29 isoform X1 n=1 Tax=Canis lupus dingo TaxID=286419 RepID=UPI0020C2E96B|nr:60S ribosomal protein L29 isoform X1 [Canis lupus dingo]